MQKQLLSLILAISATLSAVALDPTYKGYVEQGGGIMFIEGESTIGYQLSTTHGVELFEGLFVGGGLQANVMGAPGYDFDYDDLYAQVVFFAEGRYSFLREKRVSPFAGLRIGGGYEGLSECGCFYLSPAAGVTFNFTEKFGLDLSIAYDMYTLPEYEIYDYHYGYDYYHRSLLNGLNLRIGLHF